MKKGTGPFFILRHRDGSIAFLAKYFELYHICWGQCFAQFPANITSIPTPYKKKFVTLKTGSCVRCSKDGTIIKNRAFKVGKHTYVATRTGALKKNGRITIGHRRYTVKNYIAR